MFSSVRILNVPASKNVWSIQRYATPEFWLAEAHILRLCDLDSLAIVSFYEFVRRKNVWKSIKLIKSLQGGIERQRCELRFAIYDDLGNG